MAEHPPPTRAAAPAGTPAATHAETELEAATERALRAVSRKRRRSDRAPKSAEGVHAKLRLPCLTTILGQLPGRLWVLQPGEIGIGRGVANDITLTDSGVSRAHARIRFDGEVVTLTDLDSRNGTFIDGRRVREAPLRDRAKFTLGERVTLRLDWLDQLDREFQHAQFEALTRDALTQCHNRGYLEEELLHAASIAHREHRPLSALVMDLDHFKSINDRWGHAMGDIVLKTSAAAMAGVVRADDVLARVGGEEFVLLMPNTELEAAIRTAERIREAVSARRSRTSGDEAVGVTVSIGVASVAEADPVEPEALLALADARMFLAKEQGRDRVVSTGQGDRLQAVWRMGTGGEAESGRRRMGAVTGGGS